jgi:PAS domain S-box-containing protein
MIIDFQISPLRDEDGRITRLVLSAVDVTERKRIEQELSIREARYRTLFEQASVGIAKVAFDGSWIRVNPRICEILGYTSEELLTRRFDDVTYPQDREDGREALQQLKNGEIERYATEKRYVRKNGTIIWCNLSTVRHVDDDGETAFLVSVVEDIDDRKKAEATRELLIDELNHRVRNMLTVVKSIASQTLRHSSSLTEFGDAFEGRVQALATTHTLLSDNKWQGLALRDILEQQLQHASSRAKFDLVGPSVSLKPKPSLALSLVFHELATNAVKYGALAHEGGRIDVSWSLIEGAGLRMLRLLWREIGGKPVEPPTQNGFGSKLIDINISHEFGGKIERDYRSDGLLVTIDLPWRDGDRSGR